MSNRAAISKPETSAGFGKAFLWSTALLATAGISAIVGAGIMMFAPLSAAVTPEQQDDFSIVDLWRQGVRYPITRPVNILVMGIDHDLESERAQAQTTGVQTESGRLEDGIFSGRSDTMLLVQVDPEAKSVNVLSIPRDTQVDIANMGLTKINHANALGGPALAADVVSDTLNGITIDRYVRVNTEAFRELVDLLGGVEVNVPYEMRYVDQTQGLDINLQPGLQLLNGNQAEQFARFRSDGYGDIGRVQRQQQLLRALRDRVTSPTVIPKIPQAIQLIREHIDTNLSIEEILALADFATKLEQDDFRMVMLPGRFSGADEFLASYWILDPEGRDQVMQDYFHQETSTNTAMQRSLRSLRIAVQNASGEPQLAGQVADYLLAQGFSNVYVVQDSPSLQSQTQIIVQWGDLQGAARLEDILGVGQVIPASTGDLGADLTIRVGGDWEYPNFDSMGS
ncbi:MAG: LCP family protein [Synechococcales cyanobacterium T60_A2020_003]|nr:LCP family protein [Synechococcales cyanobacterium T60_A2020_003]